MKISNGIYHGADNKESLFDLAVPENNNGKIVVFIHGYMGYKDWGCWNLVQDFFVNKGYGFLKYNISHNGTSLDAPSEFNDLISFSQNTYTKENEDLSSILNHVNSLYTSQQKFLLFGHSRGGGIALLLSGRTDLIGICTLASISSIEARFPTGKELNTWQKEKVRYRKNGRTGQYMPHSIQQYDDYIENKVNLDIRKKCEELKIPIKIIHGQDDSSVKIEEGEALSKWTNTEIHIIPNTQHTFDSVEPWQDKNLPTALKEACETALNFFNSCHGR